MGNFWLKFKVWTKGIFIAVLMVYALIFVIKNNEPVKFWWWYNREDQYSMLVLIGIAFFAGVISTILVRTTFRTIRQIRDLRTRSRTDRLERDLAEMKDKASRLQVKPSATTPVEDPMDPTGI